MPDASAAPLAAMRASQARRVILLIPASFKSEKANTIMQPSSLLHRR
jgi:hypothetical protein